MKSFIRNLSAPAEFCIVMLIYFGPPFGASMLIAAKHLMHLPQPPIHFNDLHVLRLFIWELVAFAVVLWIGRIRGWSLRTFGSRISWGGTGAGVLLFFSANIVAVLVQLYMLAHNSHAMAPMRAVTTGGLTLPFVIFNSVTNPVFEEAFEAGYLIWSLERFGMWPAILAGALLRAALHAYLGVTGAVEVAATGIVFGLVYWRWRQLWPLIVSHALLDFFGLMHLNVFRLLHLTGLWVQ